jgi:hypothetical protein
MAQSLGLHAQRATLGKQTAIAPTPIGVVAHLHYAFTIRSTSPVPYFLHALRVLRGSNHHICVQQRVSAAKVCSLVTLIRSSIFDLRHLFPRAPDVIRSVVAEGPRAFNGWHGQA